MQYTNEPPPRRNQPHTIDAANADKQRVSGTHEQAGTSPRNVLRMFVSAFNHRGGFPFDPSNPNGFSRETLEAMDDAATGRASGPCKSNSEMRAATFNEEE